MKYSDNKNKSKQYLLITLILLLVFSIFFYIKYTLNDLSENKKIEEDLFNEGQELSEYYNEFQRALGYGGFIHNIKQYLLYRNDYNLHLINANIEDLETTYKNLKTKYEGDGSNISLAAVEDFINLTKKSYNILSDPQNSNRDSIYINELLGLETPEALSRIVALETFIENNNREVIIKIRDGTDQISKKLLIYTIIMSLVVTLGLFLTYSLIYANSESKKLKDINEKLHESEEWLQATNNIANIGGIEIYPMNNAVNLTKEALYILGIKEQDNLRLEDILVHIHESSREVLSSHIKQSLIKSAPFELEIPFINVKKSKGFLHMKFKTIVSDNKIIKLRGIIQDVSNRRNLEEKLQQANKMEALGLLAGGIAHDFNNLLTAIISASQLLLLPKRGLDEKSKSYVELIIEISSRAADLTAKLLTFAGKSIYNKSNVDFIKILEDSISILKRTLDKNINISLHNETKLKAIYGDSSALQNIFINLGINSSHVLMDGGKIELTIQDTFLDKEYCQNSSFYIEEGQFFKITIKDTGSGIPDEIIHKIFDPFFTTKKMGKGTGLGLASVYATVLEHNGAITVYSKKNLGTIFTILLPCSQKDIKTNNQDLNVIKGVGKILLVDDEEIIRITTKQILIELGYSVITAKDGKEALEIFKKNHSTIDVVLMDLIMPNMSGRDAFFEMKKIDKESRIILSSGFTDNIKLSDLTNYGLSGYISKPYRVDDLSKTIMEVIDS